MSYAGQSQIAFQTGFNDGLFGRPNNNPYDIEVVGKSHQAYEEGFEAGELSDEPPRGPKGDTGDTGPTGATGPAGPPGAAGSTTLDGLTDTDLSSQGAMDLFYNADGTNWADTNGDLTWNAGTTTLGINDYALPSADGTATFVVSTDGLGQWGYTDPSTIGVTDHGALTGLADDDHTQYAEIANTETISAVWTFSTHPSGLDHTQIANIGTNTHAQIDTHIADATIHFTEASIDHGSIAGLADDDHTQYLLLAGRAGGQTAQGGTASGEVLTLRGSADAGFGDIDVVGPMNFSTDYTTFSPAETNVITYDATVPSSGAAVTAFIMVTPTIDIDSGLFIPSTVRDIGQYNQNVAPGFAVHTVFLGQPALRTDTATVQPNQSFMFASQALYQNDGAGNVTTHVANIIGMTHNCQLRCFNSGDQLNATNITGVSVAPNYSTVAGSTVNFGTIRGLTMTQPVQGLFQPGAGVEGMDAMYGVDFPNVTFGGASNVVSVIRSSLASGTNRRFLDNLSTAASDFGAGLVHHDDSGVIQFGGAVNAADVSIFWNASGFFETFFWSTSDFLEQSSPAANRFLWAGNAGNGDGGSEFNFSCHKFSLGAQTGSVGNQVGVFVAGTRSTGVGGDWSDFLLTQAANLTVDHAMGTVAGWTINAPSLSAGTGSVTNSTALLVGGNPGLATGDRTGVRIISNPSGGGGVNAALYVTAGLSRFDGRVDINNGIALGGGAAATLGTIGGSGPTAAAQAQWCEIDIGGTAHWIAVWT